MAGETNVHIVGNIVGTGPNKSIEVKRAGQGVVANFSIANTPRRRNQQMNSWEDGATVWFRCSAWGQLAEHIARNVPSGTRVVVDGYFVANSYEKNGVTIDTPVVNVTELAVSIQFADLQIQRRGGNNGGYQQQGGGYGNNGYQQNRGGNNYGGQPQQNYQQPGAPAGFNQPAQAPQQQQQAPTSPWDTPAGE